MPAARTRVLDLSFWREDISLSGIELEPRSSLRQEFFVAEPGIIVQHPPHVGHKAMMQDCRQGSRRERPAAGDIGSRYGEARLTEYFAKAFAVGSPRKTVTAGSRGTVMPPLFPAARLSAGTDEASVCPGAGPRPCRRSATAVLALALIDGVAVAAQADALPRDGGVLQLASPPRQPAGQLDVGLLAGAAGVEAAQPPGARRRPSAAPGTGQQAVPTSVAGHVPRRRAWPLTERSAAPRTAVMSRSPSLVRRICKARGPRRFVESAGRPDEFYGFSESKQTNP